MAKKSSVDTSEWEVAFNSLNGPLKESLARRMGVSGARVLLSQAKSNALIAENKEGVARRGVLSNSLYMAYSDVSTEVVFVYSISWRTGKKKGKKVDESGGGNRAPHGHLVEFGYWQPYVTYKGKDGNWWTDTTRLLASPKKIPAYPFLRPAMDSDGDNAIKAMIERGREELPKLLAGEKET